MKGRLFKIALSPNPLPLFFFGGIKVILELFFKFKQKFFFPPPPPNFILGFPKGKGCFIPLTCTPSLLWHSSTYVQSLCFEWYIAMNNGILTQNKNLKKKKEKNDKLTG